ncbi:RNHCP domain-containing protein [Oligoflexia bacterium]|nr:RNHCP domain-containing protein [Oligoflexia bacterium]
MGKKFQKNIEDFTCLNCGKEITGTGYTNHCPHCLWSRHVDINPGDRAEPCKGMMEPIAVEQRAIIKLHHKCLKCSAIKKNKISEQDDMEVVIELVSRSGL